MSRPVKHPTEHVEELLERVGSVDGWVETPVPEMRADLRELVGRVRRDALQQAAEILDTADPFRVGFGALADMIRELP